MPIFRIFLESNLTFAVNVSFIGVVNGPLKFSTARKILPLLDLLAKYKRVLACSCSPNFCVARKLAKQTFSFCSCSQKSRSARHAHECSQRPFVTPFNLYCDLFSSEKTNGFDKTGTNVWCVILWFSSIISAVL